MAAASNPSPSVQSPNVRSPRAAGASAPKSSRRRGGSPWNQIVRAGVEVEDSAPTVTSPTAAPATGSPTTAPSLAMGSPITSPATGSPTEAPATGSPTEAPATGSPRAVPERRIIIEEKENNDSVEVEGVDNGSVGAGNAGKKPVWNKPSNGVVEVSPVVMGAVSWPALGVSTKASAKASSSSSSSSSNSVKTMSDAALPTLQIAGNSTSSSHKQVTQNNMNPSSAPNAVVPPQLKSMKQRGGGGSSSGSSINGGSSSMHSPQPQDSVGETLPTISGKPATEPSPRDHQHKSHGGNDQQHHRNPFRRGNGGPHPRGDGSFHHNYGGKRDHDRGNHDWNPHNRGGAGSRDSHLQPQRGFSGRFIRPAPFIAPPMPGTVRPPFVNPMGYPDVPPPSLIYFPSPPPPDALRAMPMVAPIPPHGMFFPFPDLQLHTKIVKQIDYYFSNENLVKDTFLRDNMDDQGWVPIQLIAGFKKVSCLTTNITLIIEALRTSSVVEVQGEKVRRRHDWMKWLLKSRVPNAPSPRSAGNSIPNMLASGLQSATLDDKTSNQGHAESPFARSSSGEFNSQLLHSGAEGTGQVSSQGGGVERA